MEYWYRVKNYNHGILVIGPSLCWVLVVIQFTAKFRKLSPVLIVYPCFLLPLVLKFKVLRSAKSGLSWSHDQLEVHKQGS